jgi:protein-tyrosine phosphatase
MQMDAGSITGQFGRLCQRISRQLLNDGLIHLIASDAHDCSERNFNLLVQARSIVEKKYGQRLSRLLFFDNPRQILAGEQLIPIRPRASTARVNVLRQLSGAVSRVIFNGHSRESGNP